MNQRDFIKTTVSAGIIKTSAPIYYTKGTGLDGVYRNTHVLWELYGSEEEDKEYNSVTAEIKFNIYKPGNYRLQVSTADVLGRSTVLWKDIKVDEF